MICSIASVLEVSIKGKEKPKSALLSETGGSGKFASLTTGSERYIERVVYFPNRENFGQCEFSFVRRRRGAAINNINKKSCKFT